MREDVRGRSGREKRKPQIAHGEDARQKGHEAPGQQTDHLRLEAADRITSVWRA
jgi:hypothetical protein